MVHFIMDAVAALDLSAAHINERGTGKAQYPPSMRLGLLIYSYATVTFSSRRIETLTYENVAVRHLTADTHPDHDSICAFRRNHKELLSSAFHQVIELAARARILRLGDLTMLIVGQHVTDQANDKQQLVPTLAVVSPALGEVDKVLVDSGYHSEPAVAEVEQGGAGGQPSPMVYAAMKRQRHGRSVAQLEERAGPPAPPPDAPVAERMAHRLGTKEGREIHGLRKQTVEPVFGIIKEVLGFRRFLLRGREKVSLEWELVSTSYNLKRLFNLGMRLKGV